MYKHVHCIFLCIFWILYKKLETESIIPFRIDFKILRTKHSKTAMYLYFLNTIVILVGVIASIFINLKFTKTELPIVQFLLFLLNNVLSVIVVINILKLFLNQRMLSRTVDEIFDRCRDILCITPEYNQITFKYLVVILLGFVVNFYVVFTNIFVFIHRYLKLSEIIFIFVMFVAYIKSLLFEICSTFYMLLSIISIKLERLGLKLNKVCSDIALSQNFSVEKSSDHSIEIEKAVETYYEIGRILVKLKELYHFPVICNLLVSFISVSVKFFNNFRMSQTPAFYIMCIAILFGMALLSFLTDYASRSLRIQQNFQNILEVKCNQHIERSVESFYLFVAIKGTKVDLLDNFDFGTGFMMSYISSVVSHIIILVQFTNDSYRKHH